jgi:hypothetical protein
MNMIILNYEQERSKQTTLLMQYRGGLLYYLYLEEGMSYVSVPVACSGGNSDMNSLPNPLAMWVWFES